MMPANVLRPLRQFQLHQFADRSFELRLCTISPLSRAFFEHIERTWKAADVELAMPLRFRELGEIERVHGEKFQSFTSEFFEGIPSGFERSGL